MQLPITLHVNIVTMVVFGGKTYLAVGQLLPIIGGRVSWACRYSSWTRKVCRLLPHAFISNGVVIVDTALPVRYFRPRRLCTRAGKGTTIRGIQSIVRLHGWEI